MSQVLVGAWLWGLLLLWVWVAVPDVLFGAFARLGWSWAGACLRLFVGDFSLERLEFF